MRNGAGIDPMVRRSIEDHLLNFINNPALTFYEFQVGKN